MPTTPLLCLGAGISLALLASFGSYARADQVLFDFDRNFDFAAVEARDVKVSESKAEPGAALRMETSHHQEWPGITLKAPGGHWDLSRYTQVALEVRNVGDSAVTVCCRVDNPGADGIQRCVTGTVPVPPGATQTLTVDLPLGPIGADGQPVKLFGMRGYPATFDPRNVTQLLVFVPKPDADHVFEIDNLRARGDRGPATPVTGAFFPCIDEFGQYLHKDWPGKTHSADDLPRRLAEETKDLETHPGPARWDRYGGWAAGPQLQATGHFRTEKHQGKWWFVDPDGRLFFSQGIDCVNTWEGGTTLDERESWFRWLPPRDSEYQSFYGQGRVLHGYYAGRTVNCFDFGAANLFRKYGPDWRNRFAEMSHRRLRSWGLNTIGNWSDRDICLQRRTPYVATVGFGGKLLEGSQGYWGKFRDVFDESFAREVRAAMAREVGKTADDPWCLGYFLDNEIAWNTGTSLATAALASPADQVAKRVFLQDLQAKYGTIEKLNEKWGTQHASWDALLQFRGAPDETRAQEDLVAFATKTAETYFRTCRDAVKEVAPSGLYLGCRFAWVNSLAVAAAAKYCDVVSYNIYARSAADFHLPVTADVPLIIGEFHFGALDRGLFHTGLVPVADQNARAAAYKGYVQGVLRHPQFIGCHWFKYIDEPTTGRPLDEENYQIGFLDIVDTPYPETIAACREVGYGMYEYRLNAK